MRHPIRTLDRPDRLCGGDPRPRRLLHRRILLGIGRCPERRIRGPHHGDGGEARSPRHLDPLLLPDPRQRPRERRRLRGRRRLRRRREARLREGGRELGARDLRFLDRPGEGLGTSTSSSSPSPRSASRRSTSSPYYTTSQAIIATPDLAGRRRDLDRDLKDRPLSESRRHDLSALRHRHRSPPACRRSPGSSTSDDTVLALQTGKVDADRRRRPDRLLHGRRADRRRRDRRPVRRHRGRRPHGLVLPKGSSLTAAVSAAVDELAADGTLAELQKTWLTASDGKELTILK